MKRNALTTLGLGRLALLILLGSAWQATAQEAKSPYPSMAPLKEYLMEQNAEIALARSAAPESISRDAEIMVLGQHGFDTAVKGKNGFVCLVQRSWSAPIDDPDFWNPKLRAPICFNQPGARYNVPLTVKRTELILAGRPKDRMLQDIKAAVDKKDFPPLESGAMCYMLSKQGYLSSRGGHWRPHLMFFVPLTEQAAWGAGLEGSPVVAAFTSPEERLTTFLVPVGKWSDGTADSADGH